MKIKLLILLFSISISSVYAQITTDTLSVRRGIFNSKIYSGPKKLSNSELHLLYRKAGAFDSNAQLNKQKILAPIGGIFAAGGVALSVSALIGNEKMAYIDNKPHAYKERSIYQVIGGLGLLAAGISFIEFGNDSKVKSAQNFNKVQKNKKLKASVGFSRNGNFGMNFQLD